MKARKEQEERKRGKKKGEPDSAGQTRAAIHTGGTVSPAAGQSRAQILQQLLHTVDQAFDSDGARIGGSMAEIDALEARAATLGHTPHPRLKEGSRYILLRAWLRKQLPRDEVPRADGVRQ